MSLELSGGRLWRFVMYDDDWRGVTSNEVRYDKLVHVAGVYDGDQARLFVDGLEIHTDEDATAVSQVVASKFSILLGANPSR